MSTAYRIIVASLLAVAVTVAMGEIANAQTTCSVATLNGSCVLQAVASPTTSGIAAGGGPESLVGLMTFDGAGNFTIRLHKNANGNFVQANATGTYTVQPNCDGTYTYTNNSTGEVDTHDFVISPSGLAIREILRSTQGLTTTLRVTAGICKFDE